MLVDGVVDEPLDRGPIGDIAHAMRGADGLGCGSRGVGVAVGDHHGRAFGDEALGDACAEPAGSAGDDRHTSPQPLGHVVPLGGASLVSRLSAGGGYAVRRHDQVTAVAQAFWASGVPTRRP